MMEGSPLLVPEDASLRWWHGYIAVANREFRVRVGQSTPYTSTATATAATSSSSLSSHSETKTMKHDTASSSSDMKRSSVNDTTTTSMINIDNHRGSITIGGAMGGVELWCEPELHRLMRGHQPMLLQRLLFSKDLATFMVEVQDIVSRLLRHTPSPDLPSPIFYDRIIKDMDGIGWRRLASLDDTLTTLRIRVIDCDTREHIITVKLTADYPQHAPICTCDLPFAIALPWNANTSSLTDIIHNYQTAIDSLSPFFRVLDDIDRHCWVLEPSAPRPRAVTMRRIVLGRSCSLQIEIDPRRPLLPCECRFMGADSVATPLRTKLNTNLGHGKWDASISPRLNLERLLEQTFVAAPAPSATSSAINDMELSMECGVCYSYRLADTIPDRVCDNVKCARPYHRQCLFEWLKGVPTSMPQSFNTIFGTCPYCSEPITATTS